MMTKGRMVLAAMMAVALMALSMPSAPALAAYAGNTYDFMPLPGVVDFTRIRLADQTGTTAAQDLGAARIWYVTAKIRIKALSCTTASWQLQSADNSAFNTNVRVRAQSPGIISNTLGTLILTGYVDDLQQYLEIVPLFSGGAGTGTYDAEIDYIQIR